MRKNSTDSRSIEPIKWLLYWRHVNLFTILVRAAQKLCSATLSKLQLIESKINLPPQTVPQCQDTCRSFTLHTNWKTNLFITYFHFSKQEYKKCCKHVHSMNSNSCNKIICLALSTSSSPTENYFWRKRYNQIKETRWALEWSQNHSQRQ